MNKVPEVKFNKSGFEIRTEILDMAKGLMLEEYHSKFNQWEITQVRDEKTGQIVTSVNMPTFPGLDAIMKTAEQMYSFVNKKE